MAGVRRFSLEATFPISMFELCAMGYVLRYFIPPFTGSTVELSADNKAPVFVSLFTDPRLAWDAFLFDWIPDLILTTVDAP